jgi:hypothetical protein
VADALKVLGQSAPSATTATTLYTTPDTTETTCSSIVVCNRGGSGGTFRVSVRVAAASDATKQYLYYDQALAATTTYLGVFGLTLDQTDVVTVYASSGDFSFNLFGVETSTD